MEDTDTRGKGEIQNEIPTVTTGKETDGHRGELGLRTDMSDHPSPSSSSPL